MRNHLGHSDEEIAAYTIIQKMHLRLADLAQIEGDEHCAIAQIEGFFALYDSFHDVEAQSGGGVSVGVAHD